MMDTPLDFPVHYLKDEIVYDQNGQPLQHTGPWCKTNDRGILTKNQGRVDCQKCIRWAGIKAKQP
jgi:hypothetical protein